MDALREALRSEMARDPLQRKLNAKCWGTLVNLLFHLNLKDVDCAFKIYPRSLFDRITMKSTGALIDTAGHRCADAARRWKLAT